MRFKLKAIARAHLSCWQQFNTATIEGLLWYNNLSLLSLSSLFSQLDFFVTQSQDMGPLLKSPGIICTMKTFRADTAVHCCLPKQIINILRSFSLHPLVLCLSLDPLPRQHALPSPSNQARPQFSA